MAVSGQGRNGRRRALLGACAALALVLLAGLPRVGTGAGAGGVAPQDFPIDLEPGDVFVNAPLGVTRPREVTIERMALSQPLGVRRIPGPTTRIQPLFSKPVGVYRGAVVESLAPRNLQVGSDDQQVVLAGAGLAGVSVVRVEPDDGVVAAIVSHAPNGGSVTVELDVGGEAEAGLRALLLLDAAGRVVPARVPEAAQIVLEAPQPVIESVTPSLLAQGTRTTLTLRGRHLRGLPFQGRDPEQPVVRVLPGTGIDVGGAPVSNDDGTLVTVQLNVSATATTGTRVVQIDTQSGSSTTAPSPGNTFAVVEGTLATLTPFVSPVLGVRRPTVVMTPRELVSPALGVVRGAVIRSIDPGFASPGESVTLRLLGDGLAQAQSLAITPPDGITIDTASFDAGADEVTVQLQIDADASLFPRRLTLQLPTHGIDAPQLFEIRDAAPVVTALSPNTLVRDGSNQTIDIQGQFLSQTTAARLLPDTGIVIEDYEAFGADRARLVLRALPAAPLGPRVVRVRSPGAESSDAAVPENTLFVVDRTQIVTPIVAPLLGVRRPVTGVPDEERGAYSAALGVVRGGYATSVTPEQLLRGRVTRIRVEGSALAPVNAVAFAPADGVLLGTPAIDADGNGLEVDVTVASDAAPTQRRVVLQRDGGEIPFVPAAEGFVRIAGNLTEGPIAEDDHYTGFVNGVVDVAAADGVLDNDTDTAGGTLYAVLRRLPAAGSLNLRSDGSFVYTPNADFIGTDRFEYSAGNSTTIGNIAVVTIVVGERDDAVNDSYATTDAQPLVVPAANGLLANDHLDPAGGAQIVLQSQPTRGTIAVQPDGGFTYTPGGSAGSDTFSYRLVAPGARSLAATVTIAVSAVNDAPIAVDDSYVADRGETLDVPANLGVLRNDSDPDNDLLRVRVITNPSVGALALDQNGAFRFTPPADFVGQTTFVYEAYDTAGLTDRATVTLTVNETLAAQDDAYTVNEGEVLFVDETDGLLANDSVFPQGALRVLLDGPPEHGTVEVGNDGAFVYTPPDPDWSGSDRFAYRLQDDVVTSPPAQVTITVVGVNDPPVPLPDRYLTDENAELVVAVEDGVLANDTDVDDDAEDLTAELLTPPQWGEIDLDADGSFSYVPDVNYRGTDTFEYLAVDAAGDGTPMQVSIQVTQPPTATNDVYLVDVDTPLTIVDPELGLLANDHDAPENDELFALIDTLPQNGALTLNEDGTLHYVPNPGYSGLDVWTYQVTDTRSLSNIGTVTMAVGITSLPRAMPDEYEFQEDTELVVPAAEGVLANDLDEDTPRENLEAYLVGLDWDGANLDVQLARDGSFRVRPWNNFYGETFFVYQVYDGTDISNAAIVKLTVHPVNDGVVAEDDAFGVLRNTVFESASSGRGSIRYNDRYDEDYPVNFEIVSPPSAGSVTIDAVSGVFRYTPQQDFSGTDEFTYRVFQVDTGIGDTAVVRLRTNGPAQLGPDHYVIDEDTARIMLPGLLENDSDPDGDPIELVYSGYGYTSSWYASVEVDQRMPPHVTTVTARHHFYGLADFDYAVTDGTSTVWGDVTVQVLPVPDDPESTVDSYLVERNTPLSINTPDAGVLGNDFDPDRQPYPRAQPWAAASGVDLLPLTAQLVDDVQHGTLTFFDSGMFHYVPATDYSGTDTFTYTAHDATGRSGDVTTVTIRVNSPAVAVDDAYVTSEDVALEVSVADGLLANDTDADGDPLRTYLAYSGCAPCNGSVQVREDGSFRYTPNRDFNGQDEFFYTVRDGVAGGDTGRVVVNVLPVNDPPLTEPDTYRTREDEVLVAPEAQGTLRNDREVDGDQLVDATMIREPDHGSVAYEADGSFTYVPDPDFNGRDTFEYRVHDSTGLWTEEFVEVLVTAVNDAPVAADDGYTTPQDTALVVDAALGVMANDHDVDGPSPTASLIGLPDHGTVQLAADGSFVYQPNGFHAGIDRFQYQLDDGLGALAVGNVVIQVTPVDPPVEVYADGDFHRFIGPRLEVAAPGVLANDRVEGGTVLEAQLVLAPDVGNVTLQPDGSFVYVAPDGYVGVTGFTYAAASEGVTATARVTLDVQRADNVPPQAQGEQYGVIEDTLLDSRHSVSLLANDSDYENAPLTVEIATQPAHGLLVLGDGGHFTYRPAPDFHGSDAFTYRVSDGSQLSPPATASITVFAQNDAPVTADDAYRGVPDTVLDVATADGVLANDHDIDGDALMVEVVDEPVHGQLLMDPAGGFRYTPLPGFLGEDTFRYAATDLLALSLATVRITVAPANQPPQAQGEAFAMDEDGVLSSASVGLLTANDTDPEGDTLTVQLATPPAHGTLLLDGAAFEYRPHADFFGDDVFEYRVSDGEFAAGPVRASITVRPVNDAPRAAADLYTTQRDVRLDVAPAQGVLANDSDVEQDPMGVTVEQAPAHGTLSLSSNGGFSYQPQPGYTGSDGFRYRVSDGTDSAVGSVVIDVTASGNTRPVALGELFTIDEDTELDTRGGPGLLANDTDADGDTLVLEPMGTPDHGTLEWLPGGHLRYVPGADRHGSVEIPYAVSDGELRSATVTVRVVLRPVDDAPQANADSYYLAPSREQLQVAAARGVLANDRDADGDTLVATVVQAPLAGVLKLGIDGGFTYVPQAPRVPNDRFIYRATDASGLSAEAEVQIVMDPAAAPVEVFSDSFERATP